MIDFTKLQKQSTRIHIEPRDIFMSLPSRNAQYEYPRDVQSEVWKKWFEGRNHKNSIIKMNTGSGKTVVGLVILKSCLNEGMGPAVYVVPDNYLVQQVCAEAGKIGLEVAIDEDDKKFLTNSAILVINIHKLVNGKSVFGMRRQNNVTIGSIIIDDVHACLATIKNQYTISIEPDADAYKSLLDLFKDSLKNQSESRYYDIVEAQDPLESLLIPFWSWQEKQKEIYAILSGDKDEDYIKFSLPLVKDCLPLCNCVVSAKSIEITPKCIPIHKISSFINARRRIFMSATLPDDSPFVYSLGIDASEISTIISPEKANDIGDRLILFPQVMNKNIADDDIKGQLSKLALQYNIVVISPSRARAAYWQDVSKTFIDRENIEAGVECLKNNHLGLVVFINKYDGVDLPNEACRILVIDGLPKMQNLYDVYEHNVTPHNKRIRGEQIQKIEQGMGRGVRSNNDYCVVILMGRELADVIYRSDGMTYFSEATKTQFELSEQVWEQLKNSSLDEIFALASYSLDRDIGWITASKDALSSIMYPTQPNFDSNIIAIRNAFEAAESENYEEAIKEITDQKNITTDNSLKGLLKQHIAEYTNFINPTEAQQILKSANADNKTLLKPIKSIQFNRQLAKVSSQSQFLIDNIRDKKSNPNTYLLAVHSLLERLVFAPDSAKAFEAALKDISFLLGIFSSRPEMETGKGPDNLWQIDSSHFLIIECKNGTIVDQIAKHDCNQLNGSIQWFENHYNAINATYWPIMVHNSNIFDYACSPHPNVRIMTPALLDKFKTNINRFASFVAHPDKFSDSAQITNLLKQFDLCGDQLGDNFTIPFKMAKG